MKLAPDLQTAWASTSAFQLRVTPILPVFEATCAKTLEPDLEFVSAKFLAREASSIAFFVGVFVRYCVTF